MQPKSLQQAIVYFADQDVCHEYMRKIKWPDGKPVKPSGERKNEPVQTSFRLEIG